MNERELYKTIKFGVNIGMVIGATMMFLIMKFDLVHKFGVFCGSN